MSPKILVARVNHQNLYTLQPDDVFGYELPKHTHILDSKLTLGLRLEEEPVRYNENRAPRITPYDEGVPELCVRTFRSSYPFVGIRVVILEAEYVTANNLGMMTGDPAQP